MTRMTGREGQDREGGREGGRPAVAPESIVNLLSSPPARSLLSQNFPCELGLRPRARTRACIQTCYQPVWRRAGCKEHGHVMEG